MEEKIKLKKVISKLREDFKPSEDLIYNKNAKGATIMYPKDKKPSTRPKWFKDWYKEFKEYNDECWEKQDKRWENQEAFNSQVFEFMQRQDKFNKNQLEFNKAIMQRLDNVEDKIGYVSHRLENIVTKNNLLE